jgi:hypothetical protein
MENMSDFNQSNNEMAMRLLYASQSQPLLFQHGLGLSAGGHASQQPLLALPNSHGVGLNFGGVNARCQATSEMPSNEAMRG